MDLPRYTVIHKHVGETPLQAQEAWRQKAGISDDVSLAYAGRLDPMASGKLLILVGDECKNQEAYFGLDKEYEFEIVFGFSSDSGDVLGLAEMDTKVQQINEDALKATLRNRVGVSELPYPVFSSKPVDGKPLFMWKLEDRLNEIEIPTRQSEIYELEYIDIRTIPADDIEEYIFEKINTLPTVIEASKALGADFRRDAIRARWAEIFERAEQSVFQVARIRCVCSSGTYMRSLAEAIGRDLGMRSLAYSITRTQIGRYRRVGPIRFWTKKY